MAFLNFVHIGNDGSNQSFFVKSIYSLDHVPILSFLSFKSLILNPFYIIIDNYINALKILINLSILDLNYSVHRLS